MLIELKKLKPNPFRDFTVDPVVTEKVEELTASIKEDGFWGGVVCGKWNGHVAVGGGYHRVQAAMAAGVRTAELFVEEAPTPEWFVRVYARENATQRGNTAASQAGSIAAAVRVIAKMVLGGPSPQLGRRYDLPSLRGNIASDRGLGQDVVEKLLENVPGLSSKVVEQQLANLKASGDYARIIREVTEEVERENKEAFARLAKAEKEKADAEERERAAEAARKEAAARARAAREEADQKRAEFDRKRAEAEAALAEKRRIEAEAELKKLKATQETRDSTRAAAEQNVEDKAKVIFDLTGVAKYITIPSQLSEFRRLVTGQGVAPHVTKGEQASLARQLVAYAKRNDVEFTAAFIRDNLMNLVMSMKQGDRRISQEEQDAARRQSIRLRAEHYQDEFVRGCNLMIAQGIKLQDLWREWPKNEPHVMTARFRAAVKTAKKVVDTLERRL